jgi:hypothetical protein
MPALNYKSRFAPLVAQGVKPHSIRAWRRRPFKHGDDLSHFTGMRTKACRRIRANTICMAASPIEVNAAQRYIILQAEPGSRYFRPADKTNRRLADTEVEQLARNDGFKDADEFFAFFRETHGAILCGQLIEW